MVRAMLGELAIALVIPALDEEDAVGDVVAAVDRALVDDLVVVDNGSRDGTAERARAAGARVIREPRRGYGSACLAGLAAVRGADVVVFMDGDGSDDPADLPALLEPIADRRADLVIGSRTLGRAEPGSLTAVQRLGNALTCALLRRFWGARYTDLGPLRAVTAAALDRLEMRDAGFGFTIEMQVKAARSGLRVAEIPARYRNRREGRSKISGDIVGACRAGCRILGYVLAARARELVARRSAR
jgi:glycosyltransferase involved in cell wall biosynthesis